jgi:hypothetical protein
MLHERGFAPELWDVPGGEHSDGPAFWMWTHLAAGEDKAKAKALSGKLILDTVQLLENHGAEWKRLTDALVGRGTLDAAAVLEILGPPPAVRPELAAMRERTLVILRAFKPGLTRGES